ncbi:MAG: hypothetical protein V3T48_13735 [Vicinamibacterales bacterium]
MNSRFIAATVAGAVVLFVVGFLVFGLALAGFYETNVGSATGVVKDPPEWLWLILSTLVTAALLTLVLGWKGARDAASGAKTAAIFGLLFAMAVDFGMYSMSNVPNLTATLVDPIFVAVYMGIGGAVVGMMLGRGA